MNPQIFLEDEADASSLCSHILEGEVPNGSMKESVWTVMEENPSDENRIPVASGGVGAVEDVQVK